MNPYVKWLVSIGRDNQMIIWKLFDGHVMHTDSTLALYNHLRMRYNGTVDRKALNTVISAYQDSNMDSPNPESLSPTKQYV